MSRLPQPRFSLITAVGADDHAAVEQLAIWESTSSSFRDRALYILKMPTAKIQIIAPTRLVESRSVSHRASHRCACRHLSPCSLLADDFAPDLIRYPSPKGLVSLDVQGGLCRVENTNVLACDWEEKEACLKYVDILKVNEHEMHVLTGETEVLAAARRLEGWGVHEVVITEGSLGSFIYAEGKLVEIRAYPPRQLADATGCGDSYMTGYLYKRAQGAGYREAGCYAAAMSTLKLEHFGPFSGTEADILRRIDDRELDMTVR